MKKEMFNELLNSMKQAGKIFKGKRKTSQEEKEHLKSYNNGEWKSTYDFDKEKNKYQQIAKNTTAKNKSKKPH
jgi:hypothetical protein